MLRLVTVTVTVTVTATVTVTFMVMFVWAYLFIDVERLDYEPCNRYVSALSRSQSRPWSCLRVCVCVCVCVSMDVDELDYELLQSVCLGLVAVTLTIVCE